MRVKHGTRGPKGELKRLIVREAQSEQGGKVTPRHAICLEGRGQEGEDEGSKDTRRRKRIMTKRKK